MNQEPSLAGLATAKLAAKQFKEKLKSSPKLNAIQIEPTLIPTSIIDSSNAILTSVQERVETHKRAVELFVYWEYFTSSLNITASILSAWLLTKLNFGFIWILLIIFLANSVFKRLKLKIARDLKHFAALKMMDTNDESCEWLNTFLLKYWRQFEPVLSESISLQLNTALELNKPSFLDDLRLSQFTLGSISPRIESIKTYPRSADDILTMDLSLVFEPFDDDDISKRSKLFSDKRNSRIELVARFGKGVASIPIPILLTEVSFRGLMRVKIKFTTVSPHIDVVELGFATRPDVDFILRPLKGLDLMDLPGLSSFLTDTIHWALDTNIVDPVTIKLPIIEMMNGATGKDQIIGVLVVNAFEAKDLKNFELSGVSDPYMKIFIGGKAVARTKTIESKYEYDTKMFIYSLNPVWGEQKFILIYKSYLEQHSNRSYALHYEVMDYNKIGKDKSMGVTLPLSLSKYISVLYPSLDQHTLTTDADRDRVIEEWGDPTQDKAVWNAVYTSSDREHGKIRSSRSYAPIPLLPVLDSNSGILQVIIHQANDLHFSASSNTFIQIELNNITQERTSTKKRSNTPIWEHAYSVYLADLEGARLKLTLKEDPEAGLGSITGLNSVVGSIVGSSNNVLGWASIKVKQALGSSDWFPLSNSKSGKIRVSLKFTGMDLSHSKPAVNEAIGVAKITIKSGKSLMNVEMLSKSDPYAVVHVEGRKIGRTHRIDNTLDPVWNDQVYAVIYSTSAQINVEVYDYNKVQADKKLGSFELYFDELLYNGGLPAEHAVERAAVLETYYKDGLTIKQHDASAEVVAPLYTHAESLDKTRGRKQKGHVSFSVELYPILKDGAIKAEREVVPKTPEDTVTAELALERNVDILQALNLNWIMTFKVHEVRGLPREMNVYVQLHMSDESDCALQTKILEKHSDLVWDESCDVFIKDVQSKHFTLSVRDSPDGISRPDKPFAERSLSPIEYIGKASVWIALMGQIEVRVSCAYLPIDIVMEDSEKAENTGLLKLSILNGIDLEGVDSSGTSDPYCVILINNTKYARTKTIKHTTTPQYNESFFIPIKHRQRTSLTLEIYDYNAVLKDVLLGTVSIPLSKLCAGNVVADRFQIEGASQGSLSIQMLFEAMSSDDITKSACLLKHGNVSFPFVDETNGSLESIVAHEQLDMNHKSIFSAEDLSKPVVYGSVYLTVEGARHLKAIDANGLSDPYIKVIQTHRGKIKTHVVKKTLNPVYQNATLNVKIPPSTFRFAVKDHNAFQESKSLGEASWDVVGYLVSKDQLGDGAYLFDLWIPIELGGSGEVHITGTIIVGSEMVPLRSRASSISSVRAGSIFKRPLSMFSDKKV